MVKEMIDETHRQTNLPNESAEYLPKREPARDSDVKQETVVGQS